MQISKCKMKNKNSKSISGQVSIEFVLMFVLVALMMLGTTRLWVFFNAELAKKSPNYNLTRKIAATPDNFGGSPGAWNYASIELNDKYLFEKKDNP